MTELKSILVVDDEIDMADSVVEWLAMDGYATRAAYSCDDAMIAIATDTPQAIICDIRMPGKSGLDLLNQILEVNETPIPLVFMSGYADIKTSAALSLGAVGVFSKPANIDAVVMCLKRVVAGIPDMIPAEDKIATPVVDVCIEEVKNRIFSPASPLKIGRGGMFLSGTMIPESDGKILNLKIRESAEESDYLRIYARVCWQRSQPDHDLPSGTGLEFVAIEPPYREMVLAFLNEHKPRSFVPEK